MRRAILTMLLFLPVIGCIGQVSLAQLALRKGKYNVGFEHYLAVDSTRTYKRMFDWNNKTVFRQIPVSIWYPSAADLSKRSPLTVLNYMKILKEEEEWEHLPNEQILNWFYYANTSEHQAHLTEKTWAYPNSIHAAEKFPAVIYAPSYQASSIENFALCEFLASHGYVVIASPSRGTETRLLEGGTAKDMETQARDIEFLIREIAKYDNINFYKIATIGFSFGGLSNVLSQMMNSSIKAVVSLDGSIKYQYATLLKSPFADPEKVNVPFIHMAQKDIPKQVMLEDNIDTTLNSRFDFYNDLTHSKAYSLKFNHLTHSYFSTLGVLFQNRDKRQDKSDAEIVESYRWVTAYTLNFLNAFLKSDQEAVEFLENTPEENGLPAGLISKIAKLPDRKAFSFEDFNEVAASQKYKNLEKLYRSIIQEHPSYRLEEGKLNNLGLQLTFNPKTSKHGIDVLILATKLYPASANIFDSLAEAYVFTGNREMAIKNFQKSLALNPQNQNAINRLRQLNNEQKR